MGIEDQLVLLVATALAPIASPAFFEDVCMSLDLACVGVVTDRDLQTAMTLIVGLTILAIVVGYVCLVCCNRQHVFLRLDRLFTKQHLTICICMYDVPAPMYKLNRSQRTPLAIAIGGVCSLTVERGDEWHCGRG